MANFQRRGAFLIFVLVALILSAIPGINSFLGWFETYFHEGSHGLAAFLTGGTAVRLELHWDGSGTMWTAGGIRPIVSFAGYSGAALWGCLLYVAASRSSKNTGLIAGGLCLSVIFSLIFLVRWTDVSTLAICSAIGVTCFILLIPVMADLIQPVLRLIGAYVMVSAIRAPTFILAAGGQHNDAASLRSQLFLPEIVWVVLWVLLSLIAMFIAWRSEASADENVAKDDVVTNPYRTQQGFRR